MSEEKPTTEYVYQLLDALYLQGSVEASKCLEQIQNSVSSTCDYTTMLFICLFIYLFICLFVYLFVYLFVCLFVYRCMAGR